MSCATFIVSACLYSMLSPMFFINAFYLVLFCIHVCVDDVIEKKSKKLFSFSRNSKGHMELKLLWCHDLQI